MKKPGDAQVERARPVVESSRAPTIGGEFHYLSIRLIVVTYTRHSSPD